MFEATYGSSADASSLQMFSSVSLAAALFLSVLVAAVEENPARPSGPLEDS